MKPLWISVSRRKTFISRQIPANFDGLNFLSEQNMSVVNHKAMQGTILAHTQGGVPNMVLQLPCINEEDWDT